LFQGYVFCRINGQVAGKIVTTPGVIRIVGDGRHPLAIPIDEISAIQRIVELGVQAEPCSFLKVGQTVHIKEGPLRDLDGIVLKVKNGHRLVVSVSLLRRSVAVEIDPAWV